MHQKTIESMMQRWKKCFFTQTPVLFVLTVCMSFSASAWAGPATDQLKGTLERIVNVLTDSTLTTPAKDKERNEILRTLVKERLDEVEIARRALGAHWKERTTEEKQEFVKIFSSLLERTYLKKIDAYLAKADGFSADSILYLNEKVGERYAVVETQVKIDNESRIPVYYQLKNKEGNWLVCDIAIEGVSIVKNYRVQFYEILAHSSFQDLITKLKSKEQEG